MSIDLNIPIKNFNFGITFILFAIISTFFSFMPMPLVAPVTIFIIGIALGILIISILAPDDFKFLLFLYILGFGIRIFLSYLFYLASFIPVDTLVPGFLFVNDGLCYSEQGWHICRFAERGIYIDKENFLNDPNVNMILQGRSGNITNYDYFVSFIYLITGYSPLTLFFISSLAGSVAALFIYLMSKELFSKKVARISSFFAFFWPSFILWSTQNLKEPMIAMLIFILLWTIFYMYKYPFLGFLSFSLISIWALFKISAPFALIVISMIFFISLFFLIRSIFKNKTIAILIMAALVIVVSFLSKDAILSIVFKKSSDNIRNYKSILEALNYYRMVRAYGSLQFFGDVDISNIGNAIGFAPIGLIYAFFAPFPWQIGSIAQMMAVPETMIFYVLFPFTLKGIIFGWRKRFNQSILLLSTITAIMVFLAIVEGNSGTLFRHRSIAFYLLFIFTALGILLRNKKQVFAQKC